MQDITLCANFDCPMRHVCYRFTAVSVERQSYLHFKPVDGKCEFYMEER